MVPIWTGQQQSWSDSGEAANSTGTEQLWSVLGVAKVAGGWHTFLTPVEVLTALAMVPSQAPGTVCVQTQALDMRHL